MRLLFLWSAILFFSVCAEAQIKWAGDLRLRTQQERLEGQDQRWSQKLRLRFGVQAEVTDQVNAEIRLATAKSNRSTNQTLGDGKEPGGARRFIGLDLAFFEWKPATFAEFYFGRFKQLHFRPGGSQILLDDDIALEGVGLITQVYANDQFEVRGNFGSAVIRENYDFYYSEDLRDTILNWGQVSALFKSEPLTVQVGAGVFNYAGIVGQNFSSLTSGGAAYGNTSAGADVVANAYRAYEYFGILHWKAADLTYGIFAEQVKNQQVEIKAEATLVGASVDDKSWGVQAAYMDVQADAVPAVFTNSDWGDGTTGTRGGLLGLTWKFKKGMTTRFTEIFNDAVKSQQREYWRSHLDLTVGF